MFLAVEEGEATTGWRALSQTGVLPPTNGPNKGTITSGQPSRTGVTTGPKCFRCGEPGHRIADCHKGEKYGKGLHIDSGGAFEEQAMMRKKRQILMKTERPRMGLCSW